MKPPLRFGVYEFQPDTAELRKSGIKLKLGAQPARLLHLLIQRPGQLVTREELQKELWPSDTFIEFDAGLNTAVKKVRQALGDSPENSRYIETLPRQGYRFIAPVDRAPEVVPVAIEPVAAEPDLPVAVEAAAAPKIRARASPRPMTAALLAAAVGLGSLVAWRIATRHSPPGTGTVAHVFIDLPAEQTLAMTGLALALSPDGRNLAYVARRGSIAQIFLRPLDSFQANPIPGTEGAVFPFFSPDGKWLGFFANGDLKRVTPDGKESSNVLTIGRDFGSHNASWADDGTIYFGYFGTQTNAAMARAQALPTVWQLPLHASKPVMVLAERPEARLAGQFVQQVLPGGDDLLFSINASPADRTISVYSLKSKEQHAVVHPGMGGRYLPTGHLIYWWSNNLMAVPFDIHSLTATGSPVIVVAGVARNGWIGGQLSASDTGTLAYIAQTTPMRTIVRVDLQGHETPIAGTPGPYELLNLSPDGKKLLVMKWESLEETWSLWILHLDTGVWTRLTSGGGGRTGAVWSPDNRGVIFSSDRDGGDFANLYYIADANLTGEPAPLRLSQSIYGQFPQAWAAKDDVVAFVQGVDPVTKLDIWTLAPHGDRKPKVFIQHLSREFHPVFSPDERWVAYSSDETGRTEVYVHRYPSPEAIPDVSYKVSTGGGEAPLWSPKGDAIYYRHGRTMWEAAFREGPVPQTGPPHALFEGDYLNPGQWTRNAAISADGKSFLLLKEESSGFDPRRIHVVLNWSEDLNRMVRPAR